MMRAAVSPAVVWREEWHRRVMLLGIATLLLLSTSPVFGHHVTDAGQALLDGTEHIGTLCMAALQTLLSPVHGFFHFIIVAGVLYAVWDRARSARASGRILNAVRHYPCRNGDAFSQAAASVGVDARMLCIVPGLPVPAFTVGWLRPRIYLASSLAEVLPHAELAAVIAHENAHARRRDPLRWSLFRFLACSLFWIPALRRLASDLDDEAEVLADDAAAERDPLALASAILTLAKWPGVALRHDAVGFHRYDLIARRVQRLAGEPARPRSHVTRRSLASAALALTLVWMSGAAVTSAEHDPAAMLRQHCQHHHGNVPGHLFCGTVSFSPLDPDCRHG